MTPSTWTWRTRNNRVIGSTGYRVIGSEIFFDSNSIYPVKTLALQDLNGPTGVRASVFDDDEGGAGRLRRKSSRRTEVTEVKQFLVMKWVQGLNQMAGMVALPGLFTLEAAQELVKDARDNEPNATFMIQDVGTA